MLDLLEVLRNAVLITGLVLIMMLMIEYCNIGSHGSLFARLKSSGINQVLIGTLAPSMRDSHSLGVKRLPVTMQ